LAGLVLVHVVLGLWFNTATPIFEAPDEDGHYLFIRYLQLYHSLPVQTLDTQGPRAHHPPLFHLLAAVLTAWVPVTGDAHRIDMQVNPKVWFRYDDPNFDNKAQWIHYGPQERWPYSGQALVVHITRVLALAFSVVGVLFTYLLARQLRPGPDGQAMALLATGLVALNPMPIGLTLLYDAWRQRRPRIVFTGGLAIALPFLALTGWWFWRNYTLYGDFTANKIVQKMWCCDPIPPLLALKLFLTGLLGRFGNGLMITYPYAIYWLAAALGLFALAGTVPLALRAARARQGGGQPGWRDAAKLAWLTPDAALWLLHGATIVGVFGALLVYAATVAPGLPGRYTFPAYPSMACVLAAGWLAWFRPRWRWAAAIGLVALNLAAVLFALFGMLIPTYRMPPSPSASALRAMTPVDANIGSTAQVLGYKLSAASLRPGDTLVVTLYVQPLSRTDVPYTVFLHLIEGNTAPITQRDSYPGLGNYATTVWDVGRTFVDAYQLKLPADAPPATAQLVYGLYNGDSGARLPVTGADAGTADQAWVKLGTVEVKP
jgi:hypothetical protein